MPRSESKHPSFFLQSLPIALLSLSPICLFSRSTWSSPFSVSVSSFTACHSPVYSSPVSFSVSSSKFSFASCCALIHFKGANYIFSNFLCPLTYLNLTFQNFEHWYQYLKAVEQSDFYSSYIIRAVQTTLQSK